MQAISIIMPTHNNLTQLKKAIESLYASTNTAFRLWIVESECTDGTKEYLKELSKEKQNLIVLEVKKEGSIKACTHALRRTIDDDVFITHDDVVFKKTEEFDWLAKMQELANKPAIGIVALKNSISMSGPAYLDGLPWVGTWSLFIPRRTIDLVGILDDHMKIGEDIDYAYRMYKNGLKIEVLNFAHEHHQVRDTPHQPQDSEIIGEAAKYFKQKHALEEQK